MKKTYSNAIISFLTTAAIFAAALSISEANSKKQAALEAQYKLQDSTNHASNDRKPHGALLVSIKKANYMTQQQSH